MLAGQGTWRRCENHLWSDPRLSGQIINARTAPWPLLALRVLQCTCQAAGALFLRWSACVDQSSAPAGVAEPSVPVGETIASAPARSGEFCPVIFSPRQATLRNEGANAQGHVAIFSV